MASRTLDLTYSYGGTREDPLVKDTVLFTFDAEKFSCLQEALLHRTELLLKQLCERFDSALAQFDDDDNINRMRALDIMVATVIFTTKNVLMQSPSVHYALMYSRIQEVFARKPIISLLFGESIGNATEDLLQPCWVNLRAIDASFGEDVTEEKTK